MRLLMGWRCFNSIDGRGGAERQPHPRQSCHRACNLHSFVLPELYLIVFGAWLSIFFSRILSFPRAFFPTLGHTRMRSLQLHTSSQTFCSRLPSLRPQAARCPRPARQAAAASLNSDAVLAATQQAVAFVALVGGEAAFTGLTVPAAQVGGRACRVGAP